MEMKTQYRLSTPGWSAMSGKWGPWMNLTSTPAGWRVDVANHQSIEFRLVPVKCQAVTSFELDNEPRQCDLDAHDESTPHHYMFEAICECEHFALTWK